MITPILAGNYDEYYHYLDFISKSQSDFKYIHKVKDLRSLKEREIVLIGTYDERDDWPQIADYLSYANFKYKEL